jgi:hypothetical protein
VLNHSRSVRRAFTPASIHHAIDRGILARNLEHSGTFSPRLIDSHDKDGDL